MPELPEVEAARRLIAPAMHHARIDDLIVRRPDLRIPFPERFRERVTGRTVTAMDRRGKYLLGSLSSGETLVMHLGMSGSFRVEPARGAAAPSAAQAHDHVVFHMSSGAVVTFNDPRRFGLMDLVPPGEVANHPTLSGLGPEPLSGEFDAGALARACRGRTIAVKLALLDQCVVAGVGNIYASEALHRAGISPLRAVSSLVTPRGLPRPAAGRLTDAVKRVLAEAIERETGRRYRGSRFRVYDRSGDPCPTRGCGGTIRQIVQAGRSTFYCPRCQR